VKNSLRLVRRTQAAASGEAHENPVGAAQRMLERELTTQPRVALARHVWKDMELLFKSQKELCDTLKTTAKTWRDMKFEEGVREITAQRVLIEFISLLRRRAEGVGDPVSAIHELLVPALDKKYSPYLTTLNFDELLARREPPPQQPTG
jgi:hypothetical protein